MKTQPHPQHRKRLHCGPALPDIPGLEEPRDLIHECIGILEEIYTGIEPAPEDSWLKTDFEPEVRARRVRDELLALVRSPAWPDHQQQARAFWRLLHRRKRERVLLFCRDRSPSANLIHLMCKGRVLDEDFLRGWFMESHFPLLTCACGQLSGASLRVCDAREPDVFLLTLFEAYPHFDCAVCDWVLEPDEIRAAARMTKDSPVAFLCPQ